MEEKSNIFGIFQLYYFKKGKNATETHKKICLVHGEDAVTDQTCQKWFVQFRAGDFSLDNAPGSGRPIEVDSNQIETLIENNQHYTTWEIADMLKISKSSTENHLHQLVYVSHFGVWLPHTLSEQKPLDHISTCNSLLKGNKRSPSCENTRITTGCWTIIDGKTLDFTKEDTPRPRTEEKPQ